MATYYRFDGSIQNTQGVALAGVDIYVCTQPANTSAIPPSPLATIYSDSTGTALANPVVSDGNGNFFFYAAAGIYTIVIHDPDNRIPDQIFADQGVLSPGGGSVTSVAMTGDGVIFSATVTGSPITSSGTLVPALKTQNANTALMGPTSGGAATPTFRTPVAADLPAATTSAQGAVKLANDLGGTGALPTVVQTHLTNPLPPGQGGSGSIQAKGTTSGAVTFDGSLGTVMTITLNGNATLTFSNGVTGMKYVISVTQDGTGAHTFTFPGNAKGWNDVSPLANQTTTQEFFYDGTFLKATGPAESYA